MVKSVIALMSVLTLPLYVCCQTPSVGQGVAYQGGLSGKQWFIAVENHSKSTVTGLHVGYHCQTSKESHVTYIEYQFDPHFHFTAKDKEIPPGGSFQVYAADPTTCPGGVDAVIFSDGHTEGNAMEIEHMYLRRRGAYEALNDSIDLIDSIHSQNKATLDIIHALDQRGKSLSYDRSTDDSIRAGRESVYSTISTALKSNSDTLPIPFDRTANTQPEIEIVMSENNVTHDQARAILMGNRMREWKTDIEGNLEPSTSK